MRNYEEKESFDMRTAKAYMVRYFSQMHKASFQQSMAQCCITEFFTLEVSPSLTCYKQRVKASVGEKKKGFES